MENGLHPGGNPHISVVMATYNRGNVLPYSIGSVLDQTFQDFELLVVGDGCTDESQSVVESIGDPRVRWIGLATNSGHQSVPNNVGIREARGDLIAYIGHDDLWLPHHLEACCAAIEKGCDLAYGFTLLASEHPGGECLGPPRSETVTWIPPSSVVHRKSIVESIGDWKSYSEVPRMSPDRDLWDRMQKAGFKFTQISRVSVVKIPAAKRESVYLKRSTFEQEHWQRRIRSEPAFEAAALIDCYFSTQSDLSSWSMRSYETILRFFIGETIRRARKKLRRLVRNGEPTIEQNRRFKGLPAKPGKD